jgi:hypothetical protein
VKIACTFLLTAVLVGPVHAQGCSGGDGGGIDATGNQCSTLNEVPAPAEHASFWARYEPLIKLVEKPSGRSSAPMVATAPARTMRRAAVPASAPVMTTQVWNRAEETCSGGAYGGMDTNGSQCGEAPAAVQRTVFSARSKIF